MIGEHDCVEVTHETDGKNHTVKVKSLKVLLTEEGGSWFAQGLEIDYAAYGKSIQETKNNFELGLKCTITEYLKLHGSIEEFLIPAPKEAWKEYYSAIHNLDEKKKKISSDEKESFPFGEIEYLEPKAA